MSNLTSFLSHVSVSPRAVAAFQKDPANFVKNAGLSASAKQAVLSKDPAKIRDAILNEKGITPGAAAAGDIEVVLVIVI
jgi:hypothetical protein